MCVARNSSVEINLKTIAFVLKAKLSPDMTVSPSKEVLKIGK